MNDVGILIKIM